MSEKRTIAFKKNIFHFQFVILDFSLEEIGSSVFPSMTNLILQIENEICFLKGYSTLMNLGVSQMVLPAHPHPQHRAPAAILTRKSGILRRLDRTVQTQDGCHTKIQPEVPNPLSDTTTDIKAT